MSTQPSTPERASATCTHDRLLARYRNRSAQLEGDTMGYKCQSCLAEFLPADPVARRFRAMKSAEASE